MPPTHIDEGLRAAREIRAKHPRTAVLVLSRFAEPGYALELLGPHQRSAGVHRSSTPRRQRRFCVDSSVVSQLVGRRRRDDPLADLTRREREVLRLMAEGLSNAAIAERIVVTERAVEKHVTSIFRKLHLPAAGDTHRRVLAVLTYLRS